MEINSIFLHHIDVKSKVVTQITLDENSLNLIGYINSLVQEILEQPNKRSYKFKEGNTEVKSSLVSILDDIEDIDTVILNNANRLLEKETKTQDWMSKRLEIEIQKGSLLHLHFVDQNINQIIICKVEHDEVLSEINFDLIKGLNTKKKVFKAILIYFDKNNNITHNYVFDKNNSKYWWDDFLELYQLNTDDGNTDKSINAIDKVLTPQRKKYYADYLILRNSMIGHYRSKNEFNFSDLMIEVFNNYEPIDPEFPLDGIIEKIKELPEKKGFDTQFSIVKKYINKRVQNKIRLANNLYLNVDDYVENLKNIIEPFQDEQGNKFVKIRSSEGYETLKGLLKDGSRNS
jgi:hypothetical protein